MSTLAEIEKATNTLAAAEMEELMRFLAARLRAKPVEASASGSNLWRGARERLRQIWGERVLSEREVAEMRDFEDGERA